MLAVLMNLSYRIVLSQACILLELNISSLSAYSVITE